MTAVAEAPAATQPVLEARGLTAGYGTQAVVHEVDLFVRPGEVVALLGRNGAGKTTTLLALSGELPPLGGEVLLEGRVTRAPLHRRARAGLAFVTEERSVFKTMSAADNLRVGDSDPSAALELFPELGKRLSVSRQIGQPLDGIVGHRFVAGRTISIDYGRRQVDFTARAGQIGRAHV